MQTLILYRFLHPISQNAVVPRYAMSRSSEASFPTITTTSISFSQLQVSLSLFILHVPCFRFPCFCDFFRVRNKLSSRVQLWNTTIIRMICVWSSVFVMPCLVQWWLSLCFCAVLCICLIIDLLISLWQDKNADLSLKIEEGFGTNGLGILSVTDVRAVSRVCFHFFSFNHFFHFCKIFILTHTPRN